MSNPKHDQFAGRVINNEIDKVAITRHDEFPDARRLLAPAKLRKMRRNFKRPQDCAAHSCCSIRIAFKKIVGNRVDVSFGRRQIPDRQGLNRRHAVLTASSEANSRRSR